MNLQQLRTFLTIIETGSLVRAAAVLNLTQSTVTARLKTLEAEMGQTLIQRHKSGATLTASGLRLQRYAETITELWHQAKQETALPDDTKSVVNIGSHPDLWRGLSQPLFDKLTMAQPRAAVSVWHGGQADLVNWIDRGLIDITLSFWPTAKTGYSIYPLPHDELILVTTDPASPIRFDPGYVFVEAGEEFGRQHAKAYSDADSARISFGSATLGLDHILSQGGSAYLPRRLVESDLASGCMTVQKTAPTFTRPIYLILRDRLLAEANWLMPLLRDLFDLQSPR